MSVGTFGLTDRNTVNDNLDAWLLEEVTVRNEVLGACRTVTSSIPSIKLSLTVVPVSKANVPTLILDGYRGAASKAGAQISPTQKQS